jgi:hypothetical protein
MQYLTIAGSQAKEESKLAAFIGFVIGNSQMKINNDYSMPIKFPLEALMNLEQLSFSKPIKLVNPINAPVLRKLYSVLSK